MKSSDRNRLEMRITEALDGELRPEEIRQLEAELREHPNLFEQYRKLSSLPGLSPAFDHLQPPHFALGRLQTRLEAEAKRSGSFAKLLALYFRRYILTGAAVLMIGVLSARYYVNTITPGEDDTSGLLTTDTSEQFTDIPEYQFIMDLGITSTTDQTEQN